MEQYYNFIKNGEKSQIDAWLSKLDALYSSGKSAISDENYDHLIRLYEERFGKRKVVGSDPTNREVQLPIAMMSLDKIMKEKELNNFMKKNPGPYVVMDKINGNAGLYEVANGTPRLYNRGNGTVGSDLSHVLVYLNLPVLPFDVHVKGELVIDKKDYEKYKDDYRTNLSMVNGLLNSIHPDPERIRYMRFIAYDMSFPNNTNIELKPSETLRYLVKYGFKIPFNYITEKLSIPWLSAFFKQQKEKQPYDVDGMVIVADRNIKYEERLVRENPKYSVAFKEYGETAVATVINVLWESSKHGVIKPVVKIEPVMLNNFTIKSLTAFNANFVKSNKIGPGTKLLITHNTIPHILSVLESTEAQMPNKDDFPNWKWNDTNVDIVLTEDNDQTKIARLHEFFSKIGAKYWGEKTIEKLYNGGFDTLKKLVETSKEEFVNANIEGVKEGIILRMINERERALNNVLLADLMASTSAFGIGIGSRKVKAILNIHPNLMNEGISLDDVLKIDGFSDITANKFIDGLMKFRSLVNEIPILRNIAYRKQSQTKTNNTNVGKVAEKHRKYIGKNFVFSGFRDKDLQNYIENTLNGTVKSSVSRKTDILIYKGNKGLESSKTSKAREYGKKIIDYESFIQ